MHIIDVLVIAGVVLALFGPKMLQSIARDAGKGVGKAKEMKETLMSDLPMEDIHNMTRNVPRVPLNSRQALGMLMTSTEEQVEEPSAKKAAKPVKEFREGQK